MRMLIASFYYCRQMNSIFVVVAVGWFGSTCQNVSRNIRSIDFGEGKSGQYIYINKSSQFWNRIKNSTAVCNFNVVKLNCESLRRQTADTSNSILYLLLSNWKVSRSQTLTGKHVFFLYRRCGIPTAQHNLLIVPAKEHRSAGPVRYDMDCIVYFNYIVLFRV